MDFCARYQQELDHLLIAGQSFSKVHSQARHLAQRSGDPDVERLLEGFAFLSAKVQARIDAGVPEIVHGLTELLAPAKLRPIPSCTMLEFSNDPAQGQDLVELPLHTQICSEKVQDLRLRFRTTRPMTLIPMVIERTELRSVHENACSLAITLRGTKALTRHLAQLGHLDLFVHGSCEQASDLFQALMTRCPKLEIQAEGSALSLHNPHLQALGLSRDTPLFPWPEQAWQGQRTLAEYFTLPAKFRQLRLQGLEQLSRLSSSSTLTLVFHLDTNANSLTPMAADPVKLNCCPAINLFECDAEPITQDLSAHAQGIRACGHKLDQFELYDVGKVTRTLLGQDTREVLPSLYSSFTPPSGSAYLVERRPNQLDQHSDCFLRILDPSSPKTAQRSLISMELVCSHRDLPSQLLTGQINRFSQPVAAQVGVCDLGVPTPSSPAPLHGELQWQFVSLLAAARSARPSKAGLQGLLWNYNHPARRPSAQGKSNKQLCDAIRDVRSHGFTGLVQGSPARGRASVIDLEQGALREGQAFIFGQILHELLADTVALNTLHRTELCLHPSGRTLTWAHPQRLG